MLETVECQNLKSLELSRVRIFDGLLDGVTATSQFLETLTLNHISKGLETFNIYKSLSLKVFMIQDCGRAGEIDAPNLESLEYKEDQVPKLKIAKFKCSNILNAAWFCKLRKFLSNSTSWYQVSLCFSECNGINMKDLQLHHTVSTPKSII